MIITPKKTSELKVGDLIQAGNSYDGFVTWTVLRLGRNYNNIIDVVLKTPEFSNYLTEVHANSQWQVMEEAK
jgi:hypothetical protein